MTADRDDLRDRVADIEDELSPDERTLEDIIVTDWDSDAPDDVDADLVIDFDEADT